MNYWCMLRNNRQTTLTPSVPLSIICMHCEDDHAWICKCFFFLFVFYSGRVLFMRYDLTNAHLFTRATGKESSCKYLEGKQHYLLL